MEMKTSNKKNLVPFICQTISIIELLITLIFVLSFNLNVDSNVTFNNIRVRYFDMTKCCGEIEYTSDLYANKGFRCDFDTYAKYYDRISITSNQDTVNIGKIIVEGSHSYSFYFYVGDCSSDVELIFKYNNVTTVKSFTCLNTDIEAKALIDRDFLSSDTPYISELNNNTILTGTELEQFKTDYPYFKKYLDWLPVSFSTHFIYLNFYDLRSREEILQFNNAFIYNKHICIDFLSNRNYGQDDIFSIAGIHFSAIQISKEYLDYLPVLTHVSSFI